jgi:hypothetical protein
MTKQKLLETVGQMPDNFDLDELIERLIVIEKIDKAMDNVVMGRVVADEEARKRIEEIKSKGR